MKKRGLTNQDIEILTHQPHDEALLLMKECDFLVLPSNRDSSYSGFPLKALEYVRALRVVLAASSVSNRDVFTKSFQPFWYESNDLNSLCDYVSQDFDLSSLESYLMEGNKFCAGFTWLARTRSIIDLAEKKLLGLNFS